MEIKELNDNLLKCASILGEVYGKVCQLSMPKKMDTKTEQKRILALNKIKQLSEELNDGKVMTTKECILDNYINKKVDFEKMYKIVDLFSEIYGISNDDSEMLTDTINILCVNIVKAFGQLKGTKVEI